MWNRLTERARKAVYCADDEARRRGSNVIYAEHLLLGILKDEGSTAVRILSGLGASREAIIQEIDLCESREVVEVVDIVTLSESGRRAIDSAYFAARELSNSFIGTEHLLLGITRGQDARIDKLLARLGASQESVLKAVKALQEDCL